MQKFYIPKFILSEQLCKLHCLNNILFIIYYFARIFKDIFIILTKNELL